MISPSKVEQNYFNLIQQINKDTELGSNRVHHHYFGDLLIPQKGKYLEPTMNLELMFNDNHPFEELKFIIEEIAQILDQQSQQGSNSVSKYNFLHCTSNNRQSLIKIIKLFENFSNSMSLMKISPQLLLEFMSTKLRLFSEAKDCLIVQDTNNSSNMLNEDFDDLERYIALNLIRIHEKFEQVLETGETNVLYNHLENLAKLWVNLARTGKLNTLKQKEILMQRTSNLFSRFGLE